MNEIVKNIYDYEKNAWGFPQEYKDIKLYPIKMKEVDIKKAFFRTMLYPKGYIPDKKIIKMSYLKYVLFLIQANLNPKGSEILSWLIELFKYVTKEDVLFTWNWTSLDKQWLDIVEITLIVGDKKLNEEDFDNMREIILQQNGTSLEYVEAFNPEYEQMMAFFRKENELDLTDEIFAFSSLTGLSLQEVGEYSVFQFQRHFEKILLLEDYRMYRPLEASGQIKLKTGEIKHFLTHMKETERYEKLLVEKDKYVSESDLFKAVQVKN